MDQQAYPNLTLESLLSNTLSPLDVNSSTSMHISQRSTSNRRSVLGVPVQHGNGTEEGYVADMQFDHSIPTNGQPQRNPEPTYVIPSTSSNRSQVLPEQLQSCQLCKWHSYEPIELLQHMREYHHIDTDHVVSNQIGGCSSDSIGQAGKTTRNHPSNESTRATTTSTAVSSQPSISTEVEHLISIMNGNLECTSESSGEAVFICQFCKSTFKKKRPAEAHMWIEHIRSEWAEASGNENVDEVYLQYLEVQFTRLESGSAGSSSKETRNQKPTTPPPPSVAIPEPAFSSTSESRAVKFIRPDGEEFFCTVCKIRATRAHRLIGHIVTVHFGSDEADKWKNQRKSRPSATLQRSHSQAVAGNIAPAKRGRGRPRRRPLDLNSAVESVSGEVIDCLPDDSGGLQKKIGRPYTKSLSRIGNGVVSRKHTGYKSWPNNSNGSSQVLGSKESQKMRSNIYLDANGRLQKKRGRPSKNFNENSLEIGSLSASNGEKSDVPDPSSCLVGRYKFFKCDGCGQMFSKIAMLQSHKSCSCEKTRGASFGNEDPTTAERSPSKAFSDAVTKKYRFPKRTSHGVSSGSPVKRRKFRHPKRKTYCDDAKLTKRSPPMSPSREESTIVTKGVCKKSESTVVTKSAREKSETVVGVRRRRRPRSQKKVQSIKRKTKTSANVIPEVQNAPMDQTLSLTNTDKNAATILYECKLCSEKFLGQPLFKYHLVSVHYGEIKSFDIVDSIISEMGKEVVEKQAELPEKTKKPAVTRKRGPQNRRRSQIQGDARPQPNFDDILSRKCVVSIEKLRWNGPLPNCLAYAAMDLCVKVSPKIFRCKNCGEKFRCFSDCYSHSRAKHYGERKNQCHVCSKYFTDESFQNHILSCGVKK